MMEELKQGQNDEGVKDKVLSGSNDLSHIIYLPKSKGFVIKPSAGEW